MIARLLLLGLWALLGGAFAFGAILLLDELGLALVLSLVIVGLLLRTLRPGGATELVGLAAGPGVLLAVVGELDDAPGLVLIGGAILAASTAVYLAHRPQGPASA